MPIKEKFNDLDLGLVEVLEDSIWFNEFMFDTNGGNTNKQTWPKKKFNFRWYQKDLLTDQNPYVLVIGGRSLGKCQPTSGEVYTTEGYQSVRELISKTRKNSKDFKVFSVYAFDGKQFVPRRAIIKYNAHVPIFQLVTESNHKVNCSNNHPFLTESGWKLLKELSVGEKVAVTTELPWESTRQFLQWHELRFLGYKYLSPRQRGESKIYPRYKKIKAELELIAKSFDVRFIEEDGAIILGRKRLTAHPVKILFEQIGGKFFYNIGYFDRVVKMIMLESKDNIKIFLEALFAQYAEISLQKIRIPTQYYKLAQDIQELLLRFSIETKINDDNSVELLSYQDIYLFLTEFTLPGIAIDKVPVPPRKTSVVRFEEIKSITQTVKEEATYAIQVQEFENYISSNVIVHNSVALESKLTYEIFNQDLEFPETKELLLTTPNLSQLEMPLNRLITRFKSNNILQKLMKSVNKARGYLEFTLMDQLFTVYARIAGSSGGEQNVAGLHLSKVRLDEAALYPLSVWNQLIPAINKYEEKMQVWVTGTPNGLRNAVLYYVDKKFSNYKKYKIPSHNNPFYTREADITEIKRHGGENTDGYRQQVLGDHGSAAMTVISRDQMKIEPYDFYSYTYKDRSGMFRDILKLHKIPCTIVCAGIDVGYTDPTIINIFGRDISGKWRNYVQYKLHRIDYDEQVEIFDYLMDYYNFTQIGFDIGGPGTGPYHTLLYNDKYSKKFKNVIIPVQFGQSIQTGFDSAGRELTQPTKSFAADILIQYLQQHQIILSEINYEAISELERITKKRGLTGNDTYFIISEKGSGADTNDHIFASFICFIMSIQTLSFTKRKKKLGKSTGKY